MSVSNKPMAHNCGSKPVELKQKIVSLTWVGFLCPSTKLQIVRRREEYHVWQVDKLLSQFDLILWLPLDRPQSQLDSYLRNLTAKLDWLTSFDSHISMSNLRPTLVLNCLKWWSGSSIRLLAPWRPRTFFSSCSFLQGSRYCLLNFCLRSFLQWSRTRPWWRLSIYWLRLRMLEVVSSFYIFNTVRETPP